jgi:hypothetical protein
MVIGMRRARRFVVVRWKVCDTSGRCLLLLVVTKRRSSLLLGRWRVHCRAFARELKGGGNLGCLASRLAGAGDVGRWHCQKRILTLL